MKETKNMKTILHVYDYDTNKPETWPNGDAARFEAMLRLTHGRGHKMHAIKMDRDFNPEPGPVELETEFLFNNQWNTDKGRLFDWYEEAIFTPSGREAANIKRGHYLEITPEMVAIRDNTLKCQYTGMQFPIDGDSIPRFNTTQRALGSVYLKESELHMLRLLPVSCDGNPAPLTEGERAFLLPLYIEAQTKTNTALREKQLVEIRDEFEKVVGNATMERDGKLWLLDHGVTLENCIFYNHTKRFNFGWRSPYTGEAREAMLKALAKFPFDYDLQGASTPTKKAA